VLEAQQWVGNGRYQLVRFLRAGGAGVVWEARDRRPRPGESAAVAIKVLDAAAGGAAAAEREAEGAARVQHPNVVRVRDTFTEDGLAFMVMELAVGSLADLVAREGPLPPPIALGCALQACEALAAAHRAGVVHRDVKPHNLLVFADGSVRLADFGAARALMDGHTRTRTGALLGSIPFMAPEQRRDARAVQPATDVYALSVTLGWLLLGEAPEEPWTEEAAAQLRSVRAPEGLVHAFAAAGARRPEDRPADGAALLEVLRGCGVVPAPVPMPEGWEGVREEAPIATVRAAAGRGSRWTLGVVGVAEIGRAHV
jgi:serine/threonine-protein kinase